LAETALLFSEVALSQFEIGERLGLQQVEFHRLLKKTKKPRVAQLKINWPIARRCNCSACASRPGRHVVQGLFSRKGTVFKSGLEVLGPNGV
jgi:hypothetical protein